MVDAAVAIGILKVDVVRVDAAINNAGNHAFACVSLCEVESLMNLVDAGQCACVIQLWRHGARQLHVAHTLQLRHLLDLLCRHSHKGKAMAAAQHCHAFVLQILFGVAVV